MNAKIQSLLQHLRSDERGLTTVEYVIVLCLIAALAVTTWSEFGSNVEDYIHRADQKIGDEVDSAL